MEENLTSIITQRLQPGYNDLGIGKIRFVYTVKNKMELGDVYGRMLLSISRRKQNKTRFLCLQ
jgi:hypothetical protein